MKKILVTLLLVMGLITILSAKEGMKFDHNDCGQHQSRMPRNMDHPRLGDDFGLMLDELELSEAQLTKLAKIKADHRKKIIQLDADIEILKVDKMAALKDQDFSKVKKIISNIYDQREKLALEKINHMESVWKELTPEQQTKLQELRQKRPMKKMMMQQKNMEHCK